MPRLHWLLGVLIAGCSSSGGNDAGTADARTVDAGSVPIVDARPGTGDAPVGCTAGTQIAWVDDGVQRCAISAIAVLGVGATDTLDITAADVNGYGFSLLVGGAHPFTAPQTFTCGAPTPTALVELTTTYPNGTTGTVTSCSVNVTQVGVVAGDKAQGTFSAVMAVSSGGTKTITNASFDVPRQQ
jgi:hypothetical protein